MQLTRRYLSHTTHSNSSRQSSVVKLNTGHSGERKNGQMTPIEIKPTLDNLVSYKKLNAKFRKDLQTAKLRNKINRITRQHEYSEIKAVKNNNEILIDPIKIDNEYGSV